MNFLIKSLSGKKYFQGYTEVGYSGEKTDVLRIIELVQLCSLCAHENVDVAIVIPSANNTPGPYKGFQEERIHVLLVLDELSEEEHNKRFFEQADKFLQFKEDRKWEEDVLNDFFQQVKQVEGEE